MDGTGESTNKSEYGKLIIQSIPTKETEDMVVSYLSRMVKNVPAPKLARKLKRTPFVLSKNIAAKKGERIAQNLRDLGARAEFVPHDMQAQGSTLGAENEVPPEIESLDMIFEKNKPSPTRPPQPEGSAKGLITTVVVILMVAVFSLLAWQVYDLLTG